MKITAKRKGDRDMVTGVVRLGFHNLLTPNVTDADIRPGKYDCCLLIDKGDKETIDIAEKCIAAAKAKGVKELWGGKMPSKLRTPLRDGDNDETANGTPVNEGQFADVYRGKMFMSPWSKLRPGVVDRHMAKILDPEEVYAGCYVLASVSFFPYKASGNSGVGVVVNNVLKVKDGEPLAGKPTAEADFGGGDYEFDDDDDNI